MKGGALVLAAGYSRRFGSDKRLYDVEGEPLLRHTVAAVLAAQLPCRVCLRPDDGALPLVLNLPGVEFIECKTASRGMGGTLAEGVGACGDWDGLLVVLGDMAWVQPATLAALWQALAPDTLVEPLYRGAAGNPKGFGSAYFAELAALDGDSGGREIVARHRQRMRGVSVDDPGVLRDLDEPPVRS